ncbi:MAG: hypothetical protein M9949_12625, partial [Candidatus Kapabacteria bacterium]|nr:hypothetical protein [Candidatus Kapabacteria bacterium]
KCLKFSNTEMGINPPQYLLLHDAVHVNKNDNVLWITTTEGLFMFNGSEFIRNNDILNNFDPLSKLFFIHSMYKHNNGDIYISRGPNPNFVKYDGTKLDTLASHLSEDEIMMLGKHPQTNLVALDNKLYFRTIQFDLAYLDLETHEYHYTYIKDTIINNFISEEELIPSLMPIITDMQKYGDDKLFLRVDDLFYESFFYFDGKNIEKVELDRDLIFPNDSAYQINSIRIDSKLRKWCFIRSFRTLNEPYDMKEHYFIIDKNNDYFRIEPVKYGFEYNSYFNGLHELSNGATYLSIKGGFLVDDPLGVSVTESVPSFLMNQVRPNPFKDRAQVEITATRAAIDNMKVEIFDYLGKSIRQIEPFITYQPLTGLAILEIETDGIRPGYYYLVVTDNSDTRTMPIMIK